MPKKYLFSAMLTVIVIFVCLPACRPIDVPMKDGYYTAEIAEFAEYGWKEYITICVSGGGIISVEYDAFNKSGFLKSWDMDYMRSMLTKVGTYPNEYTRVYEGKLLRGQVTEGIDCISGATLSYRSFIRLAEAAIESARMGRTMVALIRPAETGGGNSDPPFLY